MTLTGLLADGSPFSVDLITTNGFFASDNDFVSNGATLTVTLVSNVGNIILGDVDQDGVVTFLDIPAFIDALISGMFVDQADVNQDGVVDFSDIPVFIAILNNV